MILRDEIKHVIDNWSVTDEECDAAAELLMRAADLFGAGAPRAIGALALTEHGESVWLYDRDDNEVDLIAAGAMRFCAHGAVMAASQLSHLDTLRRHRVRGIALNALRIPAGIKNGIFEWSDKAESDAVVADGVRGAGRALIEGSLDADHRPTAD